MAFWIVSGCLALVVAALILRSLVHGRAETAPAASFDVQVYRDQLDEVERDLARGTIAADEAERVRTEVSRRLLEADRAAQRGSDATRAPRAATLAGAAAVALTLAGAFGLYVWIGAPGYPDLPLSARLEDAENVRADRMPQSLAEAAAATSRPETGAPDPQLVELMEKLRAAMQENPDDVQGLQFLVVNEARLGNFTAAYEAKRHMIEVKGDAATADDYADQAELMILAADGYVSPETESVLIRALERDPRNGPARYYMGVNYTQIGRFDLAYGIWRALLADSAPDAPWVPILAAQMPAVAQRAGERWSAAALPGPSAEDVEAAQDMSEEDRQEMIRGMVDGLAERLANDGGTPEEWARLISALGVLGETDRAAAIWTEAQTVFADTPEALEPIRFAAQRAGVAE